MKDTFEQLPIRVSDRGIDVNGETFTGDDVGTIFCYPNPKAPRRLVAVYTAMTPAALYQVHTRFGNWFNWGIHDCRKWFDYAVYDARTANPETYPLVGFFGTNWSFDHGRTWRPIPRAPIDMLPQHTPKHAEPPSDRVVYLSDVKPTKINQMRGAVGFDRSWRGRRIAIVEEVAETEFSSVPLVTACDRGLGVRCPSSVTFAIGGGFRALRTVVGFTDEREEPLSADRMKREAVAFVVIGDGKVLHTEEIDWKMPSAEVDVDVTGVKKLTLKVKPLGGALWLHGSSAWGDARVER